MTVHVCSLSATPDQIIPPNIYTLLRFPYDSVSESYDAHGMHQPEQPDGYTVSNWATDDRSGLIWPAVDGWGDLIANIDWETASSGTEGYDELRDQFVRDPLGLAGAPDYTAVDHRSPSPGQQYFTKHHAIFVHPGTPLGVMVRHNDTQPRKIIYAQFKLAIHPA